jgi:hypothetical protein
MKDLITLPQQIRAADSLNTISEIITDKLRNWDCFDLDVESSMLPAVKRVIKARDLDWEDPGLQYGGVITIVVGVKGADFKAHEEER